MNLEQKLSLLAKRFWESPKDKNLTESYQAEIAEEYKRVVLELIKSGEWLNQPKREDMLPETHMPQEFYRYWNHPVSKIDEPEAMPEAINLNEFQQDWLRRSQKRLKTKTRYFVTFVLLFLIGFPAWFSFQEAYSPLSWPQHIKNLIIGVKWLVSLGTLISTMAVGLAALYVIYFVNNQLLDFIENDKIKNAKEIYQNYKNTIISYAAHKGSVLKVILFVLHVIFYLAFLCGACYISGSIIFFSEICMLLFVGLLRENSKNLVSEIVTPDNLEWLE